MVFLIGKYGLGVVGPSTDPRIQLMLFPLHPESLKDG